MEGRKFALKPISLGRRPVTAAARPAMQLDDGEAAQEKAASSFTEVAEYGGASAEASRPPPLVIERQPNRDWRGEAMRRRVQALVNPEASGTNVPTEDTTPLEYGLQVTKKRNRGENEQRQPEAPSDVTEVTLTEDERAMKALIAEANGEGEQRNLVIPLARDGAVDDSQAFRDDVASRPAEATLDQYERVPVEEFGAALLRGMGWKDGQEVGKNAKGVEGPGRKVEQRPAFLGIGAKSQQASAEELGLWGRSDAANKRRQRVDKTYVPVVMINKRTGREVSMEDGAAVRDGDGAARRDRDDGRRPQNGEGRSSADQERHREKERYESRQERYRTDRYGSHTQDRHESHRQESESRPREGRQERYQEDKYGSRSRGGRSDSRLDDTHDIRRRDRQEARPRDRYESRDSRGASRGAERGDYTRTEYRRY